MPLLGPFEHVRTQHYLLENVAREGAVVDTLAINLDTLKAHRPKVKYIGVTNEPEFTTEVRLKTCRVDQQHSNYDTSPDNAKL